MHLKFEGKQSLLDPLIPAILERSAGQALSCQRKICIVTETYSPEINGVANMLTHLVSGLVTRGNKVSIICPRGKFAQSSLTGKDSHIIRVPGAPLPGYKGLHFGFPAGGLLRTRWVIQRPDVIYVATEGPLGWSAVRTAACLGIPVLSGFHTNFHSYSQHYHAGWLQNLIARYLCWFHNHTSGTLVPSADLRDRLVARGFHNVSVVGRGVDNQLFSPARRCPRLRASWGATERDLVVLYVGRVAREKNIELAIAAYRAMQARGNTVRCVIVGDGPRRAALQQAHRDLYFCGVRRGEELARHYASADIFLMPSETETFGNVTLEAMASGLAVVAYDYAAANTHIEHGRTGVLAPFGDMRGYLAAATALMGSPSSLVDMRRQAREYALTLTWPRIVQQFEMLLTKAMANRPTTSGRLQAGTVIAQP